MKNKHQLTISRKTPSAKRKTNDFIQFYFRNLIALFWSAVDNLTFMFQILVLLDSLLDRVLDNKKLMETPYISSAMSQLNKDKIEAKNNLLDALISKIAVCKPNKLAKEGDKLKDKLEAEKEKERELERIEKEKEREHERIEREKEREIEKELERQKEAEKEKEKCKDKENEKEKEKKKIKEKEKEKDDDKTICDQSADVTNDATNATISDMNATSDLDNEDQQNPD